MTTNPVDLARIDHLLTLEEWNALPESEFRWELVEGVPVMVAAPLVRHQRLVVRLARLLSDAVAGDREVLVGVEVLVDDAALPTVRVPDLVVATAGLPDDLPRLGAADVHVVVEVLSPGTRRTDRVAKMHDYAEAGIPRYVIADPSDPPYLTVCALRDGGYVVVGEGAEADLDGIRLDLRAARPGGAQSSR